MDFANLSQEEYDDRCSDGGIYPDQHFGNQGSINFLTWYEAWLDQSLDKITSLGGSDDGGGTRAPEIVAKLLKASSPWWKILFQRNK